MSDLYTRIEELCQLRGIKIYRMCKEAGISQSIMGDLKSGRKKGMSAVSADKVANYFGVSVSYLLGTEDENKKVPTITSDSEQELLDLFRQANPQLRMLVLGALKSGVPTQPTPGVVEADE